MRRVGSGRVIAQQMRSDVPGLAEPHHSRRNKGAELDWTALNDPRPGRPTHAGP